MWNVIVRKLLPSPAVSDCQALAPLPLKVFKMAAVVFLAASGTTDKFAVVPSAFSQSVLRGHSPA